MAMPNAPEYEPGASSWWNSSVSFEQRGRPPVRKMWLTAAIRSASAAWRDMCAPRVTGAATVRAKRRGRDYPYATDASRSTVQKGLIFNGAWVGSIPVGYAPCVKGDTTH